MLWGAAHGAALELRAEGGGVRLAGRFPYASEAELAPGRFERFEGRAFAERIEGGGDIHLLAGHDFNRPLASRDAGTLTIRDTPEALEFEADLSDRMSWSRDLLEAHRAGLIRGLSPGFKVPPGGESIERRGDGILRRIRRAQLFELSTVTRPAYPAAQVEARNWNPLRREAADRSGLRRTFQRWRP
ncbi:MAG: HK97 family phage prohead protease [Rhodobacteraceae bacterium]|nr:HK97 family phage prohead protease [Paracoccaceae bacterium]